ncbi:uncharacterized protein SPPG_08209 [Spizellomyces punctatus DAOM BR117]|uniref:Putative peptidase domain-containing protein n=1 Tax=Spizellomyces punctatus (strain DAOM BR117) TaxID=645134 RepID=A0A0L0H5R1_SPIPD|nr:uncharacterized protein SPPG_08209 [Spizellomyces punctatus DAOM BR117]KNC96304.1 hypothetical protein SPPG_08209 [Spizellomyces punctatus DAOM BR117]|eukprot:XP_016604344.1 hypothetical protein SPPG_08209 [Spizellomyces punctatus DAOM BR117]
MIVNQSSIILALGLTAAVATPVRRQLPPSTRVQMHSSCSASQKQTLNKALDDMNKLTIHATKRILDKTYEDPVYQTYFGNGESATVVGYYGILTAGKVFFSDVDNKCSQPGWAGHWRGEVAPLETVICPLSFNTTARKPLSALCQDGDRFSQHKTNYFLSSDLMHRLFHVPLINPEERVDHYASNYTEVTALAAADGDKAEHNQDSYMYFALDAYARDDVNPPNGCV